MKRVLSVFLALVLLAGALMLPACRTPDPDPSDDTTTSNEPEDTTTADTVADTTAADTTATVEDTTTGESESTDPVDATATVYDVRVEDMVNPVGIDNTTPVFSWKTDSDTLGWTQTAYRIKVTCGDDTVWDSGKVEDDRSVGIAYGGDTLVSSTEYTWTVTVWNQNGEIAVSDEATFEMGLVGEDPFSDARFISYVSKPAFENTTYTIDFDFVIHKDNIGFCFSMVDDSTFAMWQINSYQGAHSDGRVILRPHFKSNGSWTAVPGGPGNVQEVDLTDAIGYSANEVIEKPLHARIAVDGKQIKTYFGQTQDSLTLVWDYTHSREVPLYDIGFRHSGTDGGDMEIGSYDNIVLKDADGNVLYSQDFSDSSFDFIGESRIAVENGMARVGGTHLVGELIFDLTSMATTNLPVFRKEVNVKSDLVSAKIYTSGLGVYEAYINGQRIGRQYADGTVEYHELKPGFTEMNDHKFYNSYDVTWMMNKGEANAIAAVVSGGWWSDLTTLHFGKNDAFWCKLVLTYADGSTEIVVTDRTWKTYRASAVISADIFSGETYDARVSEEWKLPGFDDSAWADAQPSREFSGELVAWRGSYVTVREDKELTTQSVNVYDGVTGASASAYGTINVIGTYGDESFTLHPGQTAVVDFGQNFAGWEYIEIEGPKGAMVTVTHGEMLNDGNGARNRGNDGPEGSIYNANYRTAEATTRYILNGQGVEKYHPTFTFYGFRYIEITATQTVTVHKLRGQVVSSVEKDTGFITTSDEDVNQLISNIRWGQYSNYLSVPTDCPQRDERQGWTADAQVFSQAGCYLAFSKSFLEKFTMDMRDAQNAVGAYPGTAPTGEYQGGGWGDLGWADAGVIIPYTLYKMYGDTSVIRDNWRSMQFYVDRYLSKTDKKGPGGLYGDWLAYESNDSEIKAMLGVAFYAWDAMMMAEMAEVIGEDPTPYRELYETEKAYFIELYVDEQGRLIRSEQTVCLYALYLDLLPDEHSVEQVTKQLIRNIDSKGNRLQTGFLGTAILLPTLTKIGRSDLAYTLLLQHDNPSWLYSVDQGATTIWERWNSYTQESGFGDVGMNSFNHYAYGAVAGWMFESMAGIGADFENPGFKHVILAPKPDTRLACEASYDSAYGTIKAKSSYEGDEWTYAFTLPANTTGTLKIPVADQASCTVNGKALSDLTLVTDGIELVSVANGEAVLNVVAGSFTVVAALA